MSLKNQSVFTCISASNHSKLNRVDHDYYATDPKAIDLLLEQEDFNPHIWECACGEGHLSKALEKHGYKVRSTDLIYRGYGEKESVDFLNNAEMWKGDIITNPPYHIALPFVQKAIDSVPEGNKVAMFLKLTFLEGKSRKTFFKENPPRTIYVSSSRIRCSRNGEFDKIPSSAVAYGWFVWEKGYQGKPWIEWIN